MSFFACENTIDYAGMAMVVCNWNRDIAYPVRISARFIFISIEGGLS
jgi:hypothetical protein